MKRIISTVCAMLLCFSVSFAQTFSSNVFSGGSGTDSYEESDDDYDDYDSGDDESGYDDSEDDSNDDYYDSNQRQHEENSIVSYAKYKPNKGDQYLKIALGATVPTNFGDPWFNGDGKMKIGGIGTIGYHYFLTSFFSVGADVGFGFNSTISGNIFNHIPLLVTATLQPSIGNLEFPISVSVGAAWETYNNSTYWPGMIVKPEFGVYYRINESWSVGGNVSYTLMPELCKTWNTGDEDITAQFFNASISIKYYF